MAIPSAAVSYTLTANPGIRSAESKYATRLLLFRGQVNHNAAQQRHRCQCRAARSSPYRSTGTTRTAPAHRDAAPVADLPAMPSADFPSTREPPRRRRPTASGAKICAPNIGRPTVSIAALRRRSWARHHKAPGDSRCGRSNVCLCEACSAWVTSTRSEQNRQVSTCARSSAGQASGQ